MSTGRTVVIAVEMLAASIWVGSLVCLALVSSVARRELDGPARVALFRGVGRLYGIVGTGSLLVAIAAGIALGWPLSSLGATEIALLVTSGLLLLVTGAGMVQARRMTRRRRRALDAPDDDAAASAVRRGAALAGVLRGSIALVTLVIVFLGAALVEA